MKLVTNIIFSIFLPTQQARKYRKTANLALKQRRLYGRPRHYNTGKESDSETGLYYFGARYLDPKTGRWLSGDPAVGEYIPVAPVNDEARKRNGNLPGMGGVFNYANLHVYHYAGNNPVKYIDPDGRSDDDGIENEVRAMLYDAVLFINRNATTDEEKAVASKLTEMMNNGKVQLDNIPARRRGQREENALGYFDYGINTETGQVRGIIVIDIDKAYSRGLEGIIETLAHEGYHAVQYERGVRLRGPFFIIEEYLTAQTIVELPAYNMGLTMENKYLRQQNRSNEITRESYSWDFVYNLLKIVNEEHISRYGR